MRKSNISKFIAATTAATMLLTPATVFAADVTDPAAASSSVSGDGSLEGYVNKDVFCVVLPTISDVNFTLDPQGLLAKADSTKYKQSTGAVYFENDPASGSTDPTYSGTSKDIKFINKSSYAVEVGLSVTLNTGDVSLSAKDALASATVPSLYLGLIKDTDAAVAITSDSYDSTAATVAAVPEVDGSTVTKGYEITSSSTAIEGVTQSPNGYYYSYSLTSGFADSDAKNVVYKLEGQCDTKADWSKINTKAVTASIAWTIEKAGQPKISGSAYSRSNTANTYTLTNFTGKTISSIGVSVDGTSVAGTLPTEAYSVDASSTTLTIDGTKNSVIGAGGVGGVRYFIITLDDGTVLKLSVNVAA